MSSVQVRVGGLEAQQVAVGAGGTPRLEVGVGPLAEAERGGKPRLALMRRTTCATQSVPKP